MKFKRTLIALALVGTAGTAHAGPLAESASPFSYDYLGITYLEQTLTAPDGVTDVDTDGITLDASLSLSPQAYLTADYGRVTSDDGDANALGLGLGYHTDLGLSTPVDAFGELGLRSVDGSGDREITFGGKAGLRTALGIQGLDARVFLGATEPDYTMDDSERDLSVLYGLAADYYMSADLSLGAGYEVVDISSEDAAKMGIDDIETTSVSLKYHF